MKAVVCFLPVGVILSIMGFNLWQAAIAICMVLVCDRVASRWKESDK